MPICPDREYRSISMPLTVTATQNKRFASDYYVEGYATTFDTPYVICEKNGIQLYEIIDRNALNGADLSDIIMQFDHEGTPVARLSNNTLGIEPDERGLFIFADLSKSTDARNLYEAIANGLVNKMSWAFKVEEESYSKEIRTRTILKMKKVYDVSAVSIPANGDTDISARSYLDGAIEAERREALARKLLLLKIKMNLED